jgi:glycosyltransferase 2 family protein
LSPSPETEFSKRDQEVLHSIRLSKVVFPILLGIGVVLYLLWKQFDPEEFAKINWTLHTLLWILVAVGFVVVRHLAYAYRLYIISNKNFTYLKCIQLIFIWEFSSAISPTAVGGSAVAFFILSQEKLPVAKTATIVLYTVVLDTLFFVSTVPILYVCVGPEMIRPEMTALSDFGGWGGTFFAAYLFMATYGFFFYYGLFINPVGMRRLMVWFTSNRLFRKYRNKAFHLGTEMVVASKELKRESIRFHLSAFFSTFLAWSSRFLILTSVIIAIVHTTSLEFTNIFTLFARLEAMFVIMLLSPTPGGAGLAEFVFGGFLKDYVPKGIALVVAFIWRLISYYSSLIAGAIIIPSWIGKIIADRKRKVEKPL